MSTYQRRMFPSYPSLLSSYALLLVVLCASAQSLFMFWNVPSVEPGVYTDLSSQALVALSGMKEAVEALFIEHIPAHFVEFKSFLGTLSPGTLLITFFILPVLCTIIIIADCHARGFFFGHTGFTAYIGHLVGAGAALAMIALFAIWASTFNPIEELANVIPASLLSGEPIEAFPYLLLHLCALVIIALLPMLLLGTAAAALQANIRAAVNHLKRSRARSRLV